MSREPIGIRMTESGYVNGPLFRVRFHLSTGWVTITAWENGRFPSSSNHTRLDVEVRQGGRVIFEHGNYAKELATSLAAMRPGDTEAEYFEGYTAEQRDWAIQNGEELSMLREARYCDPETGAVR